MFVVEVCDFRLVSELTKEKKSGSLALFLCQSELYNHVCISGLIQSFNCCQTSFFNFYYVITSSFKICTKNQRDEHSKKQHLDTVLDDNLVE